MKNEQWTENQEENKRSDFIDDYLNMYTFHFFF